MPKRGRKNKNRKGNQGTRQPTAHVHQPHTQHTHHSHRHDDDADIPQIPGIPLPDVRALLQSKIAEIEKNQQEAEDEALLNPGEAVRRINAWESTWSSLTTGMDNEPVQDHVRQLTELFRRVSSLFYTTLNDKQTLQYNSSKVIKQNATFQELCRRLQAENKSTQKKFTDLHEKEQVWRQELEDHFQSSLQEIKSKINEHEQRYTTVLQENDELRSKIIEFNDFDTRRRDEFNEYRSQQQKVTEIQTKEIESLKMMLQNKMLQAKELEHNLGEAIKINGLMKQRQDQTNTQLETYQRTLQESAKCVDQVKNMNKKTMKANKELQIQYRDLSGMYGDLQQKNSRMERQIETLKNLSRTLKEKNREQASRIRELETLRLDQEDEGDARPDEDDDDIPPRPTTVPQFTEESDVVASKENSPPSLNEEVSQPPETPDLDNKNDREALADDGARSVGQEGPEESGDVALF